MIDERELRKEMYHAAFETDSDEQRWDSGLWVRYRLIERVIDSLPPAQPKARWIRVEERLPEKRDWVLGIFQEPDTGWINPIPFVCDYVGSETTITTSDYWILRNIDEPDPYYQGLKCVAWMPLPELYERSEE